MPLSLQYLQLGGYQVTLLLRQTRGWVDITVTPSSWTRSLTVMSGRIIVITGVFWVGSSEETVENIQRTQKSI